MNIFELIRAWFSWAFENPDKVTPAHAALYFWILDKNNSLGWKSKFGLPASEAMFAIGIKSYKTYSKTLKDLIEWGFVTIVERSKNQFSANIIAIPSALVKNTKALAKATSKQVQSTDQSKASIDIPNTYYQIQKEEVSDLDEKFSEKKYLGARAHECEPEDRESDEMIQKAAKAIAGFFNISEINHGQHFIRICNFVRYLHGQGKIDYLRRQLKGYMELKKDSPPRYRHKWYNYIGSPEKSYADGAWNESDWYAEWKETSGKTSDSYQATPTVTKTPYVSMIAEQLRAIEAEEQWYREHRPQA